MNTTKTPTKKTKLKTATKTTPSRPRKKTTSNQVGLKYGFRSGLEGRIAAQLSALNYEVSFETCEVRYIKPAREARYTPDFPLEHNGIIIESKGRFLTEDRQKHRLIKEQWPDLDIRFVFSNPNTKISKQSSTTYAMWCEKYGFKYAKETIPKAWLEEAPEPKRMDALADLRRK